MTKRKWILISVLAMLLLIVTILFSFVFRLDSEMVVFIGDIDIDEQDIIRVANFKVGESIFLIDKDKSTQNIEKEFPYLKVNSINTTTLRSIKIVITKRVPVYFCTNDNNAYILDDELKILEVKEISDPILTDFIEIKNDLGITSAKYVGDFVFTNKANLYSNFYKFCYDYIKLPKANGELEYLTHDELKTLIESIAIVDNDCVTSSGRYDNLKVTLKSGTNIIISKPNDNLAKKVNTVFAIYSNIVENGDSLSCTIKYMYDSTDSEVVGIEN